MEYAVFWGICQFSRSEVFSERLLLSADKMYLKAAAAVVLRSRTSYSQVCVYCNTYHHCTLPITLSKQDFRNIGDKIWHNMAQCGTVGMESFPQWELHIILGIIQQSSFTCANKMRIFRWNLVTFVNTFVNKVVISPLQYSHQTQRHIAIRSLIASYCSFET